MKHQPVRGQGVDAHQGSRHVNEFPRVFEFAFGLVMAGHVHASSGLTAGAHAAGVGTVGGHNLAGVQTDVGQKPLVPFDQDAGEKPWKRQRRCIVKHLCIIFDLIRVTIRKYVADRCLIPNCPIKTMNEWQLKYLACSEKVSERNQVRDTRASFFI